MAAIEKSFPSSLAIITTQPTSWLKFSPVQFGTIYHLTGFEPQSAIPHQRIQPEFTKPDAEVVHCNDLASLTQSLKSQQPQSVIVDHSIPWGQKNSFGGELARALHLDLGTYRDIEFVAGLISFACSLSSVMIISSILPAAMMLGARHRKWRDLVIQTMNVQALVELPAGVFSPYTSVQSIHALLRRKQENERSVTLFYPLSDRGELFDLGGQPWFRDYKEAIAGDEPKVGFTGMIEEGSPWYSAAHHPNVFATERIFGDIAESKPLGELCEIFQGLRFARNLARGKSGTPIIRGRDLSNPKVTIKDLDRFVLEDKPHERFKVKQDDILIQRIGASPCVVVVDANLEDAIAGDTVIIVRPKSSLVPPSIVAQFLSSPSFKSMLSAVCAGTTVQTITLSGLRDIPIPVLPAEINREIEEIRRAEDQLRDEADRVRSIRLSLFSVKSREELHKTISDIRTTNQTLAYSLDQSGELSFQLRNSYPFPLAFPYRLIDSEFEPMKIQYQLYQIAEGMAAYVASVMLALVDQRPRRFRERVKFAWGGKGATFGNWCGIVERSGALIDMNQSSLHRSLYKLSGTEETKSSFAMSLLQLNEYRDDFHHPQGGTLFGQEAEERISEARKHMENCLASLSFLVQHPLYRVLDFDSMRGQHNVVVTALHYVGDHPGMRRVRRELTTIPKKGDLYVSLEDGERWVQLYPFITIHHCPLCKLPETYFVDQWSSGKPARLKSFERGHSEESDEVGEALEQWMSQQAVG